MWHASANSHPPPSAKPFTAAIVGFGDVSKRRKILCPSVASLRAEIAFSFASSEMSAPAMKARPAPVTINPRMSSRSRTSVIAMPSSRIVAAFSALSLSGRLTVRVAIPPLALSVTDSYGMARELKSGVMYRTMPQKHRKKSSTVA